MSPARYKLARPGSPEARGPGGGPVVVVLGRDAKDAPAVLSPPRRTPRVASGAGAVGVVVPGTAKQPLGKTTTPVAGEYFVAVPAAVAVVQCSWHRWLWVCVCVFHGIGKGTAVAVRVVVEVDGGGKCTTVAVVVVVSDGGGKCTTVVVVVVVVVVSDGGGKCTTVAVVVVVVVVVVSDGGGGGA